MRERGADNISQAETPQEVAACADVGRTTGHRRKTHLDYRNGAGSVGAFVGGGWADTYVRFVSVFVLQCGGSL